jgi:hypothetical protein
MNTAISKREKKPSGTDEPSSNPARVLGFYVGKHNNAIICWKEKKNGIGQKQIKKREKHKNKIMLS